MTPEQLMQRVLDLVAPEVITYKMNVFGNSGVIRIASTPLRLRVTPWYDYIMGAK